jgi:hypothetical protein
MQKIISLFQRNYDGDRLVRDDVVPGAEWVLAGEGYPTKKWDGTCCKVEDGVLWKRYDMKKNTRPPEGFVAAQEPDVTTGHWPGWVKVGDGPEDKWFREAWEAFDYSSVNGTFELCGPRINGNPEKFDNHVLIRHGADRIHTPFELTFEGIKTFLSTAGIEGIVWHHLDGRMVKIKAKDFGIKR